MADPNQSPSFHDDEESADTKFGRQLVVHDNGGSITLESCITADRATIVMVDVTLSGDEIQRLIDRLTEIKTRQESEGW